MIKTARLPNGLTYVCEQRDASGKVSMQIHFKRGAAVDRDEENGLSHLMQECCLTGTTTRSRDKIAEDVENRGGSIAGHTSLTQTDFKAVSLARYAEETFAVLADVVRNPVFDSSEAEKVKKIVGQWLRQQEESPAAKASRMFTSSVFSGQTAANNVLGSEELLATFTPAQLKAAHEALLADPSSIVISIAGDIAVEDAERLIQKYFSDLQPKPATPMPKLAFTGGDAREVTPHEQMNLTFGFRAPSKHDNDRFATILFSELLDGGMSSPLFQEIREKRGLVYSVSARYGNYDDMGVFSITAGTGRGNAGELIATAFNLLGEVVREGFSDEDREKAIQRIMRSRKGAEETVTNLATRNAAQLLDHGRLVSNDEYEYRLRQITGDDIRRICGEMLKDGHYALAGVGPQDSMPSPEDIREMMQSQVSHIPLPEKQEPDLSKMPDFGGIKRGGRSEVTPKMTTLPNGMIVLTMEREGNLSCGAWVGVGADNEPEEINGASHMNEHMMFKGTPSYGPGEIDRIVEIDLGGGLNAYTSHDKTCYYFYNLEASALPKVVDICGEMVFQATLSHEEFDGKQVTSPDGSIMKAKGERDVVIEEIKRANDNLGRRQWYLMSETAYPDQPHGRTVLGPESTLRTMTAQQLADYRDIFYTANNTIFCAVGPVKHEDFVALVESKYGSMPIKSFPDLPQPNYVGGVGVLETDKAKLCTVTLAAEGVATAHADNTAYVALSLVLGEGMSSRFEKDIVNKRQLAAGVGAYLSDYRNGGTFLFSAKTEAEKIQPLVGAIYANLRGVIDDLSEAELDKVKASMEMEVLNNFETNSAACDHYACLVQAHGRFYTPADIAAEIRKLTVADVKRAAEGVLKSVPTAAFIIPEGTDRKHLPDAGQLRHLRDGTLPPDPKKKIAPNAA